MIPVFYSKRGSTALFPPSVLKTLENLGGSDDWTEREGVGAKLFIMMMIIIMMIMIVIMQMVVIRLEM